MHSSFLPKPQNLDNLFLNYPYIPLFHQFTVGFDIDIIKTSFRLGKIGKMRFEEIVGGIGGGIGNSNRYGGLHETEI